MRTKLKLWISGRTMMISTLNRLVPRAMTVLTLTLGKTPEARRAKKSNSPRGRKCGFMRGMKIDTLNWKRSGKLPRRRSL